jgi:hypothetical protein
LQAITGIATDDWKLEKGRFRWPEAGGGQAKVVLSHEELAPA